MKLTFYIFTFLFVFIGISDVRSMPPQTTTSYKDFLNVLTDVPRLFTSWLNAVTQIANQQDREHFVSIAGKIETRISKLEDKKKTIYWSLKNNDTIPEKEWKANIAAMKVQIDTLKMVLASTEHLTAQYGLSNAIPVVNRLSSDFNQKEFILNSLGHRKNAAERKRVEDDLDTAINLLDSANKNVQTFIAKLQQQ